MRINNNIPALNTHRLLNMNTNKLQEALERLSSGKRINRASDDAAGMAISEKMQAQIRGLKQSSRNSLDGISLIQTAEGALNEVHELLQRMRELSVQASNGTYAEDDLEAIQNEINQLTGEVDRIANTTQFNNISLLNRNNISEEELEIIKTNLERWWLGEAEDLIKDGYGLEADGVKMEITFTNNPNDSTAAFVRGSYTKGVDGELTGKGSNLVLNINLAHAKPIEATNDNGGSAPFYVDRIIAHEMTHAIMARTMNFGSLPTWFKEGAAEFIHGADDRLLGDIDRVGGEDEGIKSIVAGIDNLKDKSGSITPIEYSTSYVLTRYLDWQIRKTGLDNSGDSVDNDGIMAIMDHLSTNQDSTLDHAIGKLNEEGKLGFKDVNGLITAFKEDVKNSETLKTHTGIDLTTKDKDGFLVQKDTGSISGSSITNNGDKDAEDILPQGDAKELEGFKISWDDTVAEEAIQLQTGASEGQNMDILLSDMRARALGIIDGGEALNIVDDGMAEEAITKFNDAIKYVSMERSRLGSYQNRLEHTISNLDNTAENLQSAESRIADLDMALEMSEFTKLNILQQAGMSMLSQANDLPQSVLQLLK